MNTETSNTAVSNTEGSTEGSTEVNNEQGALRAELSRFAVVIDPQGRAEYVEQAQ